MKLFTLGYEGIVLSLFIQILQENEIQTLVDVRQNAWSRKAGFSKSALQAACEANGLKYLHTEKLGCPTPVRNAYRESGDWQQYTRGYLAYLLNQQNEIETLSRRAQEERCCLMCFEADFELCHRSFVAEAVKELGGFEVEHLNRNSMRSADLMLV